MTKGEIAKQNFESGYNCAQAVLLAFCDDLGFDKNTAAMLAAPFGGGMGRLREVCGTVSGMYMVLGLRINGKDDPTPQKRTAQYYKSRPCSELCRYAADLIDEFLKENI